MFFQALDVVKTKDYVTSGTKRDAAHSTTMTSNFTALQNQNNDKIKPYLNMSILEKSRQQSKVQAVLEQVLNSNRKR